jgi:hypothetical protein
VRCPSLAALARRRTCWRSFRERARPCPKLGAPSACGWTW